MAVRVKRIYDPPADEDGRRILVDRLWPRGISRDDAHLSMWCKDIAPSAELRKWFGHDPARWRDFGQRYRAELDSHPESVRTLRDLASAGTVTLLYAAKDSRHNHALVLADYLENAQAAQRR